MNKTVSPLTSVLSPGRGEAERNIAISHQWPDGRFSSWARGEGEGEELIRTYRR